MAYGIDFYDENGQALDPGYYDPPLFHSSSPIPIPLVGEFVRTATGAWKVNRRAFSYYFDNENPNESNRRLL
jgi:hypothetical protein